MWGVDSGHAECATRVIASDWRQRQAIGQSGGRADLSGDLSATKADAALQLLRGRIMRRGLFGAAVGGGREALAVVANATSDDTDAGPLGIPLSDSDAFALCRDDRIRTSFIKSPVDDPRFGVSTTSPCGIVRRQPASIQRNSRRRQSLWPSRTEPPFLLSGSSRPGASRLDLFQAVRVAGTPDDRG